MRRISGLPRLCVKCSRTTYSDDEVPVCSKCKREKRCYACGKTAPRLHTGRCRACYDEKSHDHSKVSIHDASRPPERTLEERIVYYQVRAAIPLPLFDDLPFDMRRPISGEMRTCCYCRDVVEVFRFGEVAICERCRAREGRLPLEHLLTVSVRRVAGPQAHRQHLIDESNHGH